MTHLGDSKTQTSVYQILKVVELCIIVMVESTHTQALTDEELQVRIDNAQVKLVSGKKQLRDLVEGGVVQPDDRVIALRAANQQNQQDLDQKSQVKRERQTRKTE